MATGGDQVPVFDAGRGRQAGHGSEDRSSPALPQVSGPEIRAERRRQGWSQVNFAAAVGCSLGTLKLIEHPSKSPQPRDSNYYGRIVELLHLDQPPERASAPNPDDPPLSQATKLQLARALYRIVTDEEAARRMTGEVEDFDVEGTDLIEGPSVGPTSGVVNRSSDDDPPSGTVQS